MIKRIDVTYTCKVNEYVHKQRRKRKKRRRRWRRRRENTDESIEIARRLAGKMLFVENTARAGNYL